MDSSSTFNSTLNSWAFSEAEDDEDQDVSAFLQRMAMEIPDSTLKTSPICIPDSNHKKSFRFGEDVESTYQSNQVNHEMMNERSKDSIYTASPESPTTPVSVLSPLMETFPNPHQNNTNSNNVSYYNQISFATRCFVNFEDVWFRDHGGGIGTTSLDESELSPTELDQWHKIMSNLRICGISCKKLMAPGDMGEAAGMNRSWANISPYMYQHEKPESSTSNTQILAITGKSLDPSQFSSSSRATDRRDPDYSDFQGWKSSLIWSDTAKTLFASAITGGEKESMLLLTVSKSSGKVTAENMNGGSSSNGIIWRRERGITKLYITRDIQKVIGRIRPEDQAELTNLSKQSPNLVIIALVNVTATKTTNETTTTQPLTLYDILTFFIGFDFVVLEYDDDDPMDETGQTKSIQRDLRISMKSDVETTSSDQILWQDGQIEEFFAFHGTMDPDTDADNRKIDEMYEKMWPDALDQAQELMERLNKSSTWLNGEDETFSDTSLTDNSLTSTPRNAGNFVSASSNPHHHHTHASPGARTTNHYHTVATIHANSNANANNISKPNTLIAIGESINASSHSNTMMRNTSHRRTMSAKLEPLKRIQSVSASQNQPSKVTTDLFVDSSIHYHQNNQLIHQAIQPQSSLNHQNGSVGVGNGVMTSSHFTVSASSSNNGGSQFSNTLNESGRLLGSGRKVLRPLKSAYSQRTNERANTTIGSSTAQTTIVPRSRPFTAAMRLPPLVSSNSSGIPRNVGSAKVIRSSISSISENPLQQTTFTGTGNNNNSENEAEKTPLKPCCACPDTKAARDKCVLLNGEEACADIIEMHKQCLRDHGFHIL